MYGKGGTEENLIEVRLVSYEQAWLELGCPKEGPLAQGLAAIQAADQKRRERKAAKLRGKSRTVPKEM
jgi:hypothetical protein